VSRWSERWWELLPEGRGEGRGRRARAQGVAWARAGRVGDLRTSAGHLTGRVQGARATPYLVEVLVPVLPDEAWRAVAGVVASRARHEAQLLAGQVPDGLAVDLAGTGVALFPDRSEVEVSCPCGREADPCEHVTALWESTAERFDRDPFAWLRLRGRGRERLLAEIAAARRRSAEGTSGGRGLPVAELSPGGWARARAPLEDAVVSVVAAPDTPAGPLRLLGDPPGWAGGVGAGDLFSPLVEGAARYAARLVDDIAWAAERPGAGTASSGRQAPHAADR
jgi:uncharacterized Zn finger protein